MTKLFQKQEKAKQNENISLSPVDVSETIRVEDSVSNTEERV